jgi:hypothetical protein
MELVGADIRSLRPKIGFEPTVSLAGPSVPFQRKPPLLHRELLSVIASK